MNVTVTSSVLLFAMGSVLAISGCSMEMSQVTPEAQKAIETRFPDATVKAVYGKLGNRYEITVQEGDEVSDIQIRHDGTIIEIETLIAATDLPEPVRNTVNERSKGAELIKVEKVEVFSPPGQYYEVKWLAGGFKHELEVNPDGSVR